jgi:hypothetical protein
MATSIPSANTLLDQAFFASLATDVSNLNNQISKQASNIDANSKSNSVYPGSFAFSAKQLQISHTLKTDGPSLSPQTAVEFGVSFAYPPIVVATVQSSAVSGTGSSASLLPSNVSVTDVTANGANVYVTLAQSSAAATITYKINVIAIGMTTT